MKKTFCTIITADYINYALALNSSLLKYSSGIEMNVLISDSKKNFSVLVKDHPNINLYNYDDLCQKGIGKKIKDKYMDSEMDCFRWSMKPVFISYLLKLGFDQVFYLDSDLYFFSNFDFLSKELEHYSVLLTPHWRASDPYMDKNNFSILQTSGLFNAGFIGVSTSGILAMDWWSNTCAYKCKKSPEKGLFVDQGYLDLLPIYFDGVKILRHRGCNVANWNQIECKRHLSAEGEVRINTDTDIIFVHFTRSTIDGIQRGDDGLLKPYLDEFLTSLEKYKHTNQNFSNHEEVSPALSDSEDASLVYDESFQSNDFFPTKLTSNNLDVFIVRTTIANSLKRLLPELSGTLLDVGCGQMPYKDLLTLHPGNVESYIGLDIKDSTIRNIMPDIIWQNGIIPLKDNSVDCAISTEVLEHCPDPEAVLKEVARVLKPGGLFFFTVPFLWPLHQVPYDEYRYTPYSLNRHLVNAGFVDIELNAMGGWDASMAQMIGLWVRRRTMKLWARNIMSALLKPFISLLLKKDKKTNDSFREGFMISGIRGTAKSPPAQD